MMKLKKLLAEYYEQYPNAEDPENYLQAVGKDALTRALERRAGRRLNFVREKKKGQVVLDANVKIQYL